MAGNLLYSTSIRGLGLVFALILTGCGGGSGTSPVTPPPVVAPPPGSPPSVVVSITPKLATVAMNTQTQQFTATATGDSQNLGVTWSVDSVAGGNATLGSITSSGLYTPPASGATHTITATSVANTAASATATVAVTDLPGVFTYHNSLARDGSNAHEFALTTSNVASATFGKLFSCAVDGAVYTQPLWVPGLTKNGAKHNAVLVATTHDSVYAFDADQSPCAVLWQATMLDASHGASAGETSVPNTDVGPSMDIQPEIGIIGTPVINPASNAIFLVSKSEGPAGTFHQRLHALDLTTGNEQVNGPVTISGSVVGAGYDSSGATVTFNPLTHNQRPALALVNGVVYVTWASHGDADPYHGWIIGYNVADLSQAGIYNVTADGQRGGIWMSGGAPAADASNALYVSTGNGTFDRSAVVTPNTDLGDAVLKITTTSGLALSDWFSPFNESTLETQDTDLGSGGVMLLPDQSSGPAHLLVTGGKEGILYLLNRDSMGQFCTTCNTTTGETAVVQSFAATNAIFCTPALWQNGVYVGGVSDKLAVFPFNPATGKLATTPASQSPAIFHFPGATPSISAQGTSNGIVWAIDSSAYSASSSQGSGPAVLHAYDATNLAIELWNSAQASGNRDTAGNAVKFSVPTVANGKVYIGTHTTIEVYGLLPN